MILYHNISMITETRETLSLSSMDCRSVVVVCRQSTEPKYGYPRPHIGFELFTARRSVGDRTLPGFGTEKIERECLYIFMKCPRNKIFFDTILA
jgi:hypothetical protein